MGDSIKHADVVPDGIYITFKDGRQAILSQSDVVDCVQHSQGFEKAQRVQAETDAEQAEEDLNPDT